MNTQDNGVLTAFAAGISIIYLAILYQSWSEWRLDPDLQCSTATKLDPGRMALCIQNRERFLKWLMMAMDWVVKLLSKRGLTPNGVVGRHEDVLVEHGNSMQLQFMGYTIMDFGSKSRVLQPCINKKVEDAILTAIRDMIKNTHGEAFRGLDPITTNFEEFAEKVSERTALLQPYHELFLQSSLGSCLRSVQ